LIHNASASNWSGLGGDGLWANAANWTAGVPTDAANSGTAIDPQTGPYPTIVDGEVENVGTLSDHVSTYGTIWGPEWGQHLNIYGTLNYDWVIGPVGTDSANPSVINMYGNATLNGVNLGLGDQWWWQGGPWVTLNMYNNSQVACSNFWWGGKVNIFDNSTFTVTTNFIERIVGAITDSTKSMNIAGGTLVLAGTTITTPAAYGANITNYIGRGILRVYGKAYDTNDVIITVVPTTNWLANTYVTNGDNSITTNIVHATNVVLTVPVLGALQNITLTSPRSTMMVGDVQSPGAVANFANIQGVPFTGVDAAQTGPGTLAYSSTDPTVVGVTSSGVVTAIKPGSATVSATFGSFTSINSATITVTAYTNSLIHRYSFSESANSTTTADSVGGADGTVDAGATINGSGSVTFDGNSDGNYDSDVVLPAGIVSGMDAVTIEAWGNMGSPTGYAALFAFGAQDSLSPAAGMNYIAFQPFTGVATNPTANLLFGKGDPGSANEEDATLQLVSGGKTNYLSGYVHIVGVFNPYAGYVALYTNGVLAAINNNVVNALATTLGDDPLNYLGESLYGSDPWFNGSLDEFRIYNGALTAGQILADYALGPNQFIGTSKNVSLSAKSTNVSGATAVVLSWPTNSALVAVMSTSTLGSGASWSAVTGYPLAVVGTNYQMTIPTASGQRFFRLQQY
jgi:hypothetical protein